jgi:hypothetical protein
MIQTNLKWVIRDNVCHKIVLQPITQTKDQLSVCLPPCSKYRSLIHPKFRHHLDPCPLPSPRRESEPRRARASTVVVLGLAVPGYLLGWAHHKAPSTAASHLLMVGDRKTGSSHPPSVECEGGVIGGEVDCAGPWVGQRLHGTSGRAASRDLRHHCVGGNAEEELWHKWLSTLR